MVHLTNEGKGDCNSMLQAYSTTINRATEYMRMFAIAAKDDVVDKNLKRFDKLFRMESKGPVQFTIDHIKAQRQIKNRSHKNEVDVDDVEKVENFMYYHLDNVKFGCRADFVMTRDVFMTFLTLLNAR